MWQALRVNREVLYVDKAWSWDTSGDRAAWWARMQQLGRAAGLEPLSFEKPHLQLSGLSANDRAAGLYPPEGEGDDDGAEHLAAVIGAWRGDPPAPAPPLLAARAAL